MIDIKIEKISFTIKKCKNQVYIEQGIYYADDENGIPQGSRHQSNRTLEEAIELLKQFYSSIEQE